MLLNFTKKSSSDMSSLGLNPELLNYPYDRLISRLNYKTDLFNYRLCSEKIEDIVGLNISLDWSDCCEKRAKELLTLNQETYFLSWSGGIDSTVALISLLKFWPKEYLAKITILLSHSSIEENPIFFNNYVSKFKLQAVANYPNLNLKDSNAAFVTGELGDQLFGSDLLATPYSKFGKSLLYSDYREMAPVVIESQGLKLKEGDGRKIFEHLEPIVEEAPFSIKTTFDFFWWFNFTQKWQHVKYRFFETTKWDLDVQFDSKVYHFFDTPYFQKWSIENHDKKIKDSWESYKFTAKEYIYNFTNEVSDLELMKVQSLKKLYSVSRKRIAVTSDYREIKSIEELSSFVRKQ